MYGAGIGTSSTQQERIRKKTRQQRFGITRLNGQIDGTFDMKNPMIAPNSSTSENAVNPAKRRKFGSDSKNLEVMDAEKEVEELPTIYSTPATSKRNPKAPMPNLRAFSNENSRFVKNIKKEILDDVDRRPSTGEMSSPVKLEMEPCNSVACSSTAPPFSAKSNCAATSSNMTGNSINRTDIKAEQNDLDSWAKRKFYIVENAGRPTEIYCTDFIHKVKQGMVHSKYQHWSEDNRSLLKIVDKWREEWSTNGVQVPLGKNALGNDREAYEFEQTALFPEMSAAGLFELPKRLIAHYPSTYTRKYAKDFQPVSRKPLCCYLMDSADEDWLEMEEEKGGPLISAQAFVQVMNLLEVTSYRNIHEALLEPIKAARVEEDADCMICGLPEWEAGDNIVFCDGCNISVHQSCYGLYDLPANEWFCQLCTHFGAQTAQACLFCPVKGGPMKATKHLESWAHVACALWINEVRFGDADAREPITHVNEIPALKWQSRCCVCDTRNGACIQCVHPKCDVTFHVGCAQRAEFTLNIENDDDSDTGVRMVSLCDKHSMVNQPSHKNIIRYNKKKLPEMLKQFPKYVDLQEISQLSKVPMGVVERINSYWISKRSKKNGQPLIPEPPEIVDTAINKHTKAEPKQKFASRNKQQRTTAASSFSHIPEDKLLRDHDMIRKLRLKYEKARNLCYMSEHREKLKKAQLEHFESQVRKTADLMFCKHPVMPLSKRRIEKLLHDWMEAIDFQP